MAMDYMKETKEISAEEAIILWQASRLSLSKSYEKAPEILKVHGSVIGTLGNFSASIGKAKSKKTFNVSAIVAAALKNGTVLRYVAELPEDKRKVLYVDTEQSPYHCLKVMKRILRIAALLLFLLPGIAKAQWTFDIVSVEAYINDHKKQRSLLLARSTLEYSNKLLHEYSCKEVGGYKELNIDLDRYTRAFDVIDVMYQSLRTVLNVKNTYTSVSDRIGDYKSLLEDFNAKILKRGRIESADTLIISINARGLRAIAREGEQLYKSVSDLVLYATGAAACSTSDLLMVLEAINRSLDNIERHLNRAYFETWRYIQVRIGYWKAKVYRSRTMREILDDAFGRWRGAGRLDY